MCVILINIKRDINLVGNNMINWDLVNYFKPEEFSENPDIYAEPDLIYALDKTRKKLKHKINPSPIPGALARFDDGSSTSRHYVDLAKNKKSIAVDVFCDCNPTEMFITALDSRLWRGIGIYFDTFYNNELHCMFHLDRRQGVNKTAIWFRDTRKYNYQSNISFWQNLSILLSKVQK
jgi:hypothetical protein